MGGKERKKSSSSIEVSNPMTVRFLEACAKGDLGAATKITSFKDFPLDDDINGMTGFMEACANGQLHIIKHLVEIGAGSWCSGPKRDPHPPFYHAAAMGQLEVVRYFVETIGLDAEAMNQGFGKTGRKTAMDYALERTGTKPAHSRSNTSELDGKKYQVLAYLRQKGATFGEGVTDENIVFEAASKGDAAYVLYCLIANSTFTTAISGLERQTLLHVAATGGYLDLTKVLITHGADPEATDLNGKTPLHLATYGGYVPVVRSLMEANARVYPADNHGNSAVHMGCEGGNLEVVKSLLSQDYSPLVTAKHLLAARNDEGVTPMAKAFAAGVHIPVIQYISAVLDGSVDPVKEGAWKLGDNAKFLEEINGGILSPSTMSVAMTHTYTYQDSSPEREERKEEVKEGSELEDEKEEEKGDEESPAEPLQRLPSSGALRYERFSSSLKAILWGFDASRVSVISRADFMAAGSIPSYEAAVEAGILKSLDEVEREDRVLFISHRWATPIAPDEGGHTFAQAFNYLTCPLGGHVNYVFVAYSCMDGTVSPDGTEYCLHLNRVLTALMRSSFFLAIPQTKPLLEDQVQPATQDPPNRGSRRWSFGPKKPLPAGVASPDENRRASTRVPTASAIAVARGENEPQRFSDLADFAGRGWLDWECSLAALLGLNMHLCVRWGVKATFQPILMAPSIGEFGLMLQDIGIKGAAMAAIQSVAPEIIEETGLWITIVKLFQKPEEREDPSIPVANTFSAMIESTDEPTEALVPIIRACFSLERHDCLAEYLCGSADPLFLMNRLTSVVAQDVKDGSSAIGALSRSQDRLPLSKLHMTAVAYLAQLLEQPADQEGALLPLCVQYPMLMQENADLRDELQKALMKEKSVVDVAVETTPEPKGCTCTIS